MNYNFSSKESFWSLDRVLDDSTIKKKAEEIVGKDMVVLRPHHVVIFGNYHKDGFLDESYGQDFTKYIRRLFIRLSNGEASHIKIVKGLDDVCRLCQKLAFRNEENCKTEEDEETDYDSFRKLERAGLKIGETYDIGDFLDKIESSRWEVLRLQY